VGKDKFILEEDGHVIEMGIHSELIYEVVQRLDSLYEEEIEHYSVAPYRIEEIPSRSRQIEIMSPDILVSIPNKMIQAIEIESDTGFDFDQSMRQIQKYKKKYRVKVVIPKTYEKFAELYENDGIKAYLWSGIRVWRCLNCGTDIKPTKGETGYKKPNCEKCGTKEVRLYRVQNFSLKPYSDYTHP